MNLPPTLLAVSRRRVAQMAESNITSPKEFWTGVLADVNLPDEEKQKILDLLDRLSEADRTTLSQVVTILGIHGVFMLNVLREIKGILDSTDNGIHKELLDYKGVCNSQSREMENYISQFKDKLEKFRLSTPTTSPSGKISVHQDEETKKLLKEILTKLNDIPQPREEHLWDWKTIIISISSSVIATAVFVKWILF